MICIFALIIFAILAVFSAKYRPLAAEAFDCVFRRVTFRACQSRLDQRLKAQLTGKAMKKNPAFGRFLFRYFEVFSWLFLLLMLLSVWQTGVAVYNYSVYGNCNGPDNNGFCIFDPLGTTTQQLEGEVCPAPGTTPSGGLLSAPPREVIEANPRLGNAQAQVTVIEYGCFACPNTAEQAPIIKELIEKYGQQIEFSYINLPLSQHAFSNETAISAQCVYTLSDSLHYWQYHFTLFNNHKSMNEDQIKTWALDLGISQQDYAECITNPQTIAQVNTNTNAGHQSGVYGTPTFFINNQSLVGTKTLKALSAVIDSELTR